MLIGIKRTKKICNLELGLNGRLKIYVDPQKKFYVHPGI